MQKIKKNREHFTCSPASGSRCDSRCLQLRRALDLLLLLATLPLPLLSGAPQFQSRRCRREAVSGPVPLCFTCLADRGKKTHASVDRWSASSCQLMVLPCRFRPRHARALAASTSRLVWNDDESPDGLCCLLALLLIILFFFPSADALLPRPFVRACRDHGFMALYHVT